MPRARTRVPARLKAPRCWATTGTLAAQLTQPLATNHTRTPWPRSWARGPTRPSRPTQEAVAAEAAEVDGGGGPDLLTAQVPASTTAAVARATPASHPRLRRPGPWGQPVLWLEAPVP